jgi:hypothetical protein
VGLTSINPSLCLTTLVPNHSSYVHRVFSLYVYSSTCPSISMSCIKMSFCPLFSCPSSCLSYVDKSIGLFISCPFICVSYINPFFSKSMCLVFRQYVGPFSFKSVPLPPDAQAILPSAHKKEGREDVHWRSGEETNQGFPEQWFSAFYVGVPCSYFLKKLVPLVIGPFLFTNKISVRLV